MLKIAVVEDQQEVRDELCRFIRQYAAENSLQVEVLPIEDGAVIAEHYEPGYDIIFMDVEMPGLDGFGAAVRTIHIVPLMGAFQCSLLLFLNLANRGKVYA